VPDPLSHRLAADLPPGAAGHFRLSTYAVLARVLAQLRAAKRSTLSHLFTDDEEALERRFPFVAAYHDALDAYQPDLPARSIVEWWDGQAAAWEADDTTHLPLRALAESHPDGAEQVRVLLAAGLVEEDLRLGALFAALQDPLPARRPCVGLLNWLLAPPGGEALDVWPTAESLVRRGYLVMDNPGEPRTEWVLRVPPVVWDAARGGGAQHPLPGLTLQDATEFPSLADFVMPGGAGGLERIPDLVRSGEVSAVVVRGMTGTGRRTLLGAVANRLARPLLVHDGAVNDGAANDDAMHVLGPLATLTAALPVLRRRPAPGETLDLGLLPGYDGPVGVTLGRVGGAQGPLLAKSLQVNLDPPGPSERRRFWQMAKAPMADGALDEVVDRFLLTGGSILRAANLARAHASLNGRAAVEPDDVQEAARALNREALETLAVRLDPADGDILVVSPHTAAELQALEARCRGREALREQAGPAFGALNRGVRAMFTGPSGSGKSLAARALAAGLRMDVYRVDLAAVVNKYIGETEKNLDQVLSRAEELDVVLLLDEGDALMTARTDVRNANDRYANLETNYLLQRLESYEGIVVVTTNAGNRIDAAFLRRIDVLVDFAPPGPAERLLIWRHHLPIDHAVDPELLADIAQRCPLSGGQIRNAALHAVLLAAGQGKVVDAAALEEAVRREYRKAGAAYPMRDAPAASSALAWAQGLERTRK
jgi:hypothetical protein